MIAALLKKFGVKKVVCRESSSIHLAVLNSIGISQTINPEYEFARILAQKLTLPGVENLFNISETLKIIDLKVPYQFINESVSPQNFKESTKLELVALKRNEKIIYATSRLSETQDYENIVFLENDIMVLAGEIKDIRRFLNI